MEAVFLTTPELLQEFSARVLHTLHSAGADAVCDDFTADDLLRLAHEGRVVIGVFLDDGGAVAMVMVLEFVPYPRRMVLNVVLMAGKGVRKFCRRAWSRWCSMQKPLALMPLLPQAGQPLRVCWQDLLG